MPIAAAAVHDSCWWIFSCLLLFFPNIKIESAANSPLFKSNKSPGKTKLHQLSPRSRAKRTKPGDKPYYIKESARWQRVHRMEKELSLVAVENTKYGDFLSKMRKMIDDTI